MVEVKGVKIGEGAPKLCVPMVGTHEEELLEEAKTIKGLPCDLVEWRADFFQQVMDLERVTITLTKIREIIPELPIIFTFRNKKEGGHQEITPYYYKKLNETVMETGQVDLVDVELFSDAELVEDMVKAGKRNKVALIISNHDFEKTPPVEEMIRRMLKAIDLGGDIAKIAVMPACVADVLALQEVTRRMKEDYEKGPLITMAMGGLGLITRLSGEIFGSALTFGAAAQTSAPGQIAVKELRPIIELLHDKMKKSK
ncbi:3-dehydroquinate dehydratase [Tindallia magadiensis]|uniref:3-dehydroquinate dehydratase n=1 Tax=Tindallia magadiensis TaxID=69895 RepID=A0A1I3E1V9_9FIRM|nr:type I 3-dehydroquinate dehydratase [Tindallia magadiensis]SFH92818.1 3-dehydroquinate dehydratase [Tindallia magadiensis]